MFSGIKLSSFYRSRISHATIAAYLATEYRIQGDGPLVLRIGQPNEQLAALYRKHAVNCAAVLTAWNPYSEPKPDAKNHAAQARLIAELDRLGLQHQPGHGADPTGQWPPEDSHWVGDIHQPLHVSFKDDRGGNYIGVVGACSGNLHSAWDTCLVHKAVGMDFEDAAVELLGSISPVKVEEWTRSTPTGWANESFAISERSQTKYCVQVGTACIAPDAGKVRIDATYIQENAPIIREQLQKAGVRLAHLLDAALGR